MTPSWLSEEQALARIRQVLAEPQTEPAQLLRNVSRIVLLAEYGWTCRWLCRTSGLVVRSGPLAGLKYLPASAGSLFPPKLVGSYESELHPTLEKVIATPYRGLVQVGCGEGYYAVGLARRMPALRVHAFDTDPTARDLCRRMAELNGVSDRLVVGEVCDPARLQQLAGPGTLVLCDIEGAEVDLLDPARAPALAGCDLLVECHDFRGRAISTELAGRFSPTHQVEVIANTWNNPNELAFLLGLRPIHKFFAVWEGRPGLTPWLFMTSRGANTSRE